MLTMPACSSTFVLSQHFHMFRSREYGKNTDAHYDFVCKQRGRTLSQAHWLSFFSQQHAVQQR